MVFGTGIGGIIIIIASFFTEQKYCNLIAVLFILSQTCMAVLDIAAHAAMIKEIRSKSQISIIISYSQTIGILLGGLLLLKLTSTEFSKSIGLMHPITTPQVLLLVFGILIVIPAAFLHFKLQETVLES